MTQSPGRGCLGEALKLSGVSSVECIRYPGTIHGFFGLTGAPHSKEAVAKAEQVLAKALLP